MAFAKEKSHQVDQIGLEIIADTFSLPNGTQVSSATKGAAVAALTAIVTVDATDLPTVLTLANVTKAKVNAIIAALQA